MPLFQRKQVAVMEREASKPEPQPYTEQERALEAEAGRLRELEREQEQLSVEYGDAAKSRSAQQPGRVHAYAARTCRIDRRATEGTRRRA